MASRDDPTQQQVGASPRPQRPCREPASFICRKSEGRARGSEVDATARVTAGTPPTVKADVPTSRSSATKKEKARRIAKQKRDRLPRVVSIHTALSS